jgi:hypothetical protein
MKRRKDSRREGTWRKHHEVRRSESLASVMARARAAYDNRGARETERRFGMETQ